MLSSAFHPALRLVQRPGALGPVIGCSGDLTAENAAMLRQELESLLPLGHPQLTVDFSHCRFDDAEGMLSVLECLRQASERGFRAVIIAGSSWMSRLLKVAGFDQFLTVYPDEESAGAAVAAGAPAPPPATWEVARDETLAYWRGIREGLDTAATAEVERQLTAMMAFCERAEAIFRERPRPAVWRCQYCPLFHALGGRPVDVGCRSTRDPILTAVRAGDLEGARSMVDQAIQFLEQMPLPQ